LGRGLGGPQSRSGCCGELKNSQLLPGLEPPIIQSVAQRYTTELSRLHEESTFMDIAGDVYQTTRSTVSQTAEAYGSEGLDLSYSNLNRSSSSSSCRTK
jgi:hypothetical protein